MSRNNHVFQVLVTKGNQAPLAAGSTVADLAPGQIGVFDFRSNLSIDDSSSARDFYLAVGLDLDGDGVTDDIAKSRGSHIQGRNVAYYTFRPHTPGQPMKVVLKDYLAECDTEYGIKLEMRNKEIYQTQGYNQFTKTYSMVTSCCNGCTPTCPSGDANEITKQLKANINNDENGLVKAEAIARQEISGVTGITGTIAVGEVVSDADLDALMAANVLSAGTDIGTMLYTDLEVTSVTQRINAFCNVNVKYFYPRETFIIMSKSSGAYAGFDCTGTIETTQQATFEEGSGYDLKQQEYMAKGYEGSRYRTSELVGVADQQNFNAVVGTKYDTFVLAYDQFSRNAWLEYLNAEATYVGIPAADTTTRDGFAVILDKLLEFEAFDAKADDAAAAEVDVEVIEPTTDKNADTDGLG